jgi:hypothetical protein
MLKPIRTSAHVFSLLVPFHQPLPHHMCSVLSPVLDTDTENHLQKDQWAPSVCLADFDSPAITLDHKQSEPFELH